MEENELLQLDGPVKTDASKSVCSLTVGRPAPQTCRSHFGSLVMLNTPQASVHSPPRQMNAESDNETHCSFALETQKFHIIILISDFHVITL